MVKMLSRAKLMFCEFSRAGERGGEFRPSRSKLRSLLRCIEFSVDYRLIVLYFTRTVVNFGKACTLPS